MQTAAADAPDVWQQLLFSLMESADHETVLAARRALVAGHRSEVAGLKGQVASLQRQLQGGGGA